MLVRLDLHLVARTCPSRQILLIGQDTGSEHGSHHAEDDDTIDNILNGGKKRSSVLRRIHLFVNHSVYIELSHTSHVLYPFEHHRSHAGQQKRAH